MALVICPRCDKLYEWPMGKGKRLSNYPCPKCGGPGRGNVTLERYERDRAKLTTWKRMAE